MSSQTDPQGVWSELLPDPAAAAMLLRRFETSFPSYRFSFTDEKKFHAGLAQVLNGMGVPFLQEYVPGPKERFDFLCQHGVVIEAKIKGSFAEAMRQVDRYCARADVAGVALIAARSWPNQPESRYTINGRPVSVIHVRAASF